jgi:Ca-activated chloride channel homolog
MGYAFHMVYPWAFGIGICTVLAALYAKIAWYKPTLYRYSLVSYLHEKGYATGYRYQNILRATRTVILALLAFLMGKPQLVDYHIPTIVQGIDIMLVLDVSGSMRVRDSAHEKFSRIEIAKQEALRFIQKREHDAIGLVFFAADAISRCPVTLDKNMLKQMIEEVDINTLLSEDGTLLSTSIIMAANRLKKSRAKSKIMILLTDGSPSEGDVDPAVALAIAKQLGIKIYTIGIGSENPVIIGPFFQMIPGVNKPLLEKIAQETGGRFFMAHDAHDMRVIYDTIDALEKTEHELPVFNRYYDIFLPFAWGALALLLWELCASVLIWFTL